jgi:hypothetical protein
LSVRRISSTISCACIAAISTAFAGCAWVEEDSSHFDDRLDAVNVEMFAKGWLPQWVPPTSKNLREKHAYDISISILRFEFDAAKDAPPFGDACRPTTSDAIGSPALDAWWWPETESLRSMSSLYACPKESGFLAVQTESGLAYFWRLYP